MVWMFYIVLLHFTGQIAMYKESSSPKLLYQHCHSFESFQVHYNSKTHSTDPELKSKLSADSFEGDEAGKRKSPTPEGSPMSQPFPVESSPHKTSWPPPHFPKVIVKIDEEQEEEVMLRRKSSPPPPRVPPRPQPPFTLESLESRESTSSLPQKRSGVKKANLYAWLSLQSLPEVKINSSSYLH